VRPLTHHGTVPADIIDWDVWGTLKDLDDHEQPVNRMEPLQTPVGRSLAPGDPARIELCFVGGDLPNPTLPFRLYGKVDYRGVAPWTTYSIDFDAERVGDSWKTRGWHTRSLSTPP
jgi:hypothetical protein